MGTIVVDGELECEELHYAELDLATGEVAVFPPEGAPCRCGKPHATFIPSIPPPGGPEFFGPPEERVWFKAAMRHEARDALGAWFRESF